MIYESHEISPQTINQLEIIVVIPWSINIDSRAKRELLELAKRGNTYVYYIPNSNDVEPNAVKNVHYHKVPGPVNNIRAKIIRHTFFYNSYNYFIPFIKQRHRKVDLIYIHDLESGAIGLALKNHFNAQLIYDVHDLSVETVNQQFPVNENGKTPLKYLFFVKIMRFLGRRFERKLISQTDIVVTVNKTCANYLKQIYNQEVHYFYNYPILKPRPSETTLISKHLNLQEKKNYILYIGSLGQGRHLKNIIRSAEYLNNDCVLVIIGYGHLKENLVEISKSNATFNKKVYFIDQIPYEELFEFINEGSLGLMLLDPINKSKEYAFANKITEYMLCGIPVLLSKHLEHEELLNKYNVGYLLENCTPEEIAQKINEIHADRSTREMKAKMARIAFEKEYNWSFQVSKLNQILDKLLFHIDKKT